MSVNPPAPVEPGLPLPLAAATVREQAGQACLALDSKGSLGCIRGMFNRTLEKKQGGTHLSLVRLCPRVVHSSRGALGSGLGSGRQPVARISGGVSGRGPARFVNKQWGRSFGFATGSLELLGCKAACSIRKAPNSTVSGARATTACAAIPRSPSSRQVAGSVRCRILGACGALGGSSRCLTNGLPWGTQA